MVNQFPVLSSQFSVPVTNPVCYPFPNVPLDCQIPAAGHVRAGLRPSGAGPHQSAGSHALHASAGGRASSAIRNAVPRDGDGNGAATGIIRSIVSSRRQLLSRPQLLRMRHHLGMGSARFRPAVVCESSDRARTLRGKRGASLKQYLRQRFRPRSSAQRAQIPEIAIP